MIELIIGFFIGAIISITIAEVYHRRASKETQIEINKLKILGQELEEHLQEIKNSADYTAEASEIIKDQVIKGTPHDPEFPYK